MRTVTRRVSVPWGDVAGWKSCSMSTGQRAMWAMVPADQRDGLEARAVQILDDARDDSGRVVVWQDLATPWAASAAPGSPGRVTVRRARPGKHGPAGSTN